MPALKCAHCGLVNFATATQCKRCRTPFVQDLSAVNGSLGQGIVLEDGYVLPPPPSVGMPGDGVWRDQSVLVMTKDARLPDRCVKCNEFTQGRLTRKLTWHHPALYILILVGWLIYLIVALIVRKRATVEIGLCDDHLTKRRRNILITWALGLLGLAGLFLAIVAQDGTPALLGVLLLLASAIYGIAVTRVIAPTRIDDQFVRLRGVNNEYLDALPHWTRAH